MSDYRLKIAARNARILRLIEARGYATVAEFSRASGLSQGKIGALVTMSASARLKDGEWNKGALDLASALGVEPEALFTDRQAAGRIKPIEREVDEATVIAITDARESEFPALTYESDADTNHHLRDIVAKANLSARERKIIGHRFGVFGAKGSATLDEIGMDQGVKRERIRQIEAKAMRKLVRAEYQLKQRENRS